MYSYDRRTASFDVEPLYDDDAISALKEAARDLKKYAARTLAFVDIFNRLAVALEAKKIEAQGHRIAARSSEATALMEMVVAAIPLATALNELRGKLLDQKVPAPQIIATLEADPKMSQLRTLVANGCALSKKFEAEDDNGKIQWNLEDFITDETGVYKRLERMYPSRPEEVDAILEGVVAGLVDPEVLEGESGV